MDYSAPAYGIGDPELITPFTQIHSMGDAVRTFISGDPGAAMGTDRAWPANNLAFYIPFMVTASYTVKKMSIWCTTASGTVDFGVYDENWNRLVNLGATTITTGTFVGDLTDTTIPRGRYYMAVLGSTTAMSSRADLFVVTSYQGCGMAQEAVGSGTLPSTATPASPGQTFFPSSLVLSGRTQL